MLNELLQKLRQLKRDYIAGKLSKQEVVDQMGLLLRQRGMMAPDATMHIEDLPEEFWLPCDCILCRAERGEVPLPVDAVMEVEALRTAYQFGMMSKVEALMKIQVVFRRHGVSEADATAYWKNPMNKRTPHDVEIKPMSDSEKDFFAGLEKQMKDVPKDEK